MMGSPADLAFSDPLRGLASCLSAALAEAPPGLKEGVREPGRLLAAARTHGLTVLLHRRLHDTGLLAALPAAEQETLKAAHLRALKHSTLSSRVLLEVQHLLAQRGLAALPLKGAALAALLWPDLLGRTMVDLDLLIAPAQIEEARACLVAAGFAAPPIPWAPNRWEYHLPRLEHAGLGIELHWRLWPPSPLLPFRLPAGPDLLQRSVLGTANGQPVRVPCPADQVLIAAAALAEDGFAVRLRHWADLWWLLGRLGAGEEALLWGLAGEHGLTDYLAFVLRFLAALAGPLPLAVPAAPAAEHAYAVLAPVLRQRLEAPRQLRASAWLLRALEGRRVPDDNWEEQLPPGLRDRPRMSAARNAVVHCGGGLLAAGKLLARLGGLLLLPNQRRALRHERLLCRTLAELR